jgi:PKHD-type hydroxylase
MKYFTFFDYTKDNSLIWNFNPDTFTCQEIDNLVEKIELNYKIELGTIKDSNLTSLDIRNNKIAFVNDMEDFKDLYVKVCALATSSNYQNFRLNIDRAEPLQYTVYSGESTGGEYYKKHRDYWPGGILDFDRKLSIVIQLSDPSEYEGGDLILYESKDSTITAKKEKGSAVAFTSWVEHEVTPVTKGVRKTLVAWFSGPKI